MSFLDLLLGKPLANWEETGERIGPAAGIPIFGLDALSSAAYGPEAALTGGGRSASVRNHWHRRKHRGRSGRQPRGAIQRP
jgi:hypothetical protein